MDAVSTIRFRSGPILLNGYIKYFSLMSNEFQIDSQLTILLATLIHVVMMKVLK